MSGSPETPSPEILVLGGGVLGLCASVELTRRGHDVVLVDPGGRNASSVAAGMIAPGLESVLDDVSPERAALFRDARSAWDGFGLTLEPGPAAWRGSDADAVAARLRTRGFAFEREGRDVLVLHDSRIEVEAAMTGLRGMLRRPPTAGAAVMVARVQGGWRVTLADTVIEAARLVVATGAATATPGLPDAVARTLAAIQPIRGQIGWTAERLSDRVIRGEGAYVAPSAGGSLIGATMDVGRTDLSPDASAGRRLLAAAGRMLGRDLSALDIDWRVGVRGATADGLPLAGPSGEPDLHLALAPRRNGWLLGPLVASVVADGIEGRAPGPHAAALDPRRLASPSR